MLGKHKQSCRQLNNPIHMLGSGPGIQPGSTEVKERDRNHCANLTALGSHLTLNSSLICRSLSSNLSRDQKVTIPRRLLVTLI